MSATRIDLKRSRRSVGADLPDFGSVLAQILGEPYLTARLGYADELTVHFGTPRAAEHPRLQAKGVYHDSYRLAVCASAWVLKSTPRSRLILEGLDVAAVTHLDRVTSEDVRKSLLSDGLIPVGSPVVAAVPFEIEQAGAIGLRLETADGSGLVVIPNVEEPDVDFPDWELTTPAGVARVGPGRQWTWTPKS